MHPTRTVRALVLKPSVRQLDCPIVIEREAGIPGDFPQVPVGVPEVRWPRKIGQVSKLGSPFEKDGPDDGQTEAVCGGVQGESCS